MDSAAASRTPGFVVASVGQQLVGPHKAIFTGHNIHIVDRNDNESWAYMGYFHEPGFTHTPQDIETSDRRLRMQKLAFAPGEYKITTVRFTANGSAMNKEPFSVPFSVKPGEVLYLGEFLAHVPKEKGWLGIKKPAFIYFTVDNQLSRDLPILKKKYPSLPWDNVRVADLDLSPEATRGFLVPR